MFFLLINIFCNIFLLINNFGIFSLCLLRSKDHLRRSAGGSQDGGTALARLAFHGILNVFFNSLLTMNGS